MPFQHLVAQTIKDPLRAKPPGLRDRLTAAQGAKITQMHKTGMSPADIARKTDTPYKTVWRFLRE